MLRLKEIRKKKQFTQKQLADLLEISQVQISKFEKEENVINNIQITKLCKALNCSADYLLGLIETEEINQNIETKIEK